MPRSTRTWPSPAARRSPAEPRRVSGRRPTWGSHAGLHPVPSAGAGYGVRNRFPPRSRGCFAETTPDPSSTPLIPFSTPDPSPTPRWLASVAARPGKTFVVVQGRTRPVVRAAVRLGCLPPFSTREPQVITAGQGWNAFLPGLCVTVHLSGQVDVFGRRVRAGVRVGLPKNGPDPGPWWFLGGSRGSGPCFRPARQGRGEGWFAEKWTRPRPRWFLGGRNAGA